MSLDSSDADEPITDLHQELYRRFHETIVSGFCRQSIKIERKNIPVVIVDLCANFLQESLYKDEAADPVNTVSELDKETSECYKQKGNQYFKAKEYERAIVKYTTALRFNPNNHLLFSNRAFCHYLLSNYDDALKDVERCILIEPAFVKGWFRYALSLEQLGDLNRAGVSYLRAMQLSKFEMKLSEDKMKGARTYRQCKKRFLDFKENGNEEAVKFLASWREGKRPSFDRIFQNEPEFDLLWLNMKISGTDIPDQIMKEAKCPEYIKRKEAKDFALNFERSFRKQYLVNDSFTFYDGEIGWDKPWNTWVVSWSSVDMYLFHKRGFTISICAGDAMLGWAMVCGKPSAEQMINLLYQKMTYSIPQSQDRVYRPLKGIKPDCIFVSWRMRDMFEEMQHELGKIGIACTLENELSTRIGCLQNNTRVDGYNHLRDRWGDEE